MPERGKHVGSALVRALGIVLATCVALAVRAQDSTQSGEASRIKVVVTGTNIPAIDGESGLPVQIITREAIERANFQTAAQLANSISAVVSFGSFTENQSPAGSPIPGFAGAGLRGLGFYRTLILLNGRRLANYAFGGSAVDLNVIPVSALARVEVLLDGASAIYGSDAIGGVINFITRSEFQGVEASAQYSAPEHSGGWSDRFNIAAGYGSLTAQRFNVFATVDYQQFGSLPARNRSFSKSFYIPGGFDQTSGSSFPANVIIGPVSRNPTGNPALGYADPPCAPPASFTTTSPFTCRLDPGYFINDIAPSERFATTASATVQLDPAHQLFLNGLYARNTFTFLGTPTSVPNRPFLQPSSPYYPHEFARAFGIDGQPLNIAWRAYELGPRTDEPIIEQWNFVAGLRGTWDGWTYDGALTLGRSRVDDHYTGGYVLASAIKSLLDSGVINPFGYNTPEIVSLMSKTVLHQTVRTGTSTMPAVDLRASKNVYETSAGPLSVAVGAEARQWKLTERSSEALATGNINQVAALPSMEASRTNWAVFAETAFPVVRTLEADIAVRYDHYSDVGGTTNPKMSLRWQPDRTLLLRSSVGTGFIAPSLEALYGSPVFSLTNLTSDPARCPTTRSATDCNRTFPVQGGGNPSLQNEKSSQWGAGFVWSPLPRATLSADYFDIVANNLIASFGPQTALDLCKDGVNGPTCPLVLRGPVDPAYPTLPGPIQIINSGLFNLGTIHTSGVDVSVQLATPATDWGQLSFTLQGTFIVKFDVQQTNGSYVDRVNHQVNVGGFGSIPYWHHYLTINWTYGPWSATLIQNFQKGTYDQSPNPGETQLRKIGNYDVWNLSGSYSGLRNWVFSLGIKNLLDRDPPFTNQTAISNGGGPAGYDPTYTDPRGRSFWASVKYNFR